MFFRFQYFGRSAEVANQYLKKGSKVLLEGRLVFEQWTAQDGSTRSRHSLRVDTMKMLDNKPQEQNGNYYNATSGYEDNFSHQQQNYPNPNEQYKNQNTSSQKNQFEQRIPEIDIDEDEIPF